MFLINYNFGALTSFIIDRATPLSRDVMDLVVSVCPFKAELFACASNNCVDAVNRLLILSKIASIGALSTAISFI